MSREALERFRAYWETLTPESVARAGDVYGDDVRFRDPFNDLRGLAAMKRVLASTFETLDAPVFVVTETLLDGDRALLVWDFRFRVRRWKPGVERSIHGVSLVRFAADGRVSDHQDYWDAAGQLYAQLPVIGPVVRWLARKLGEN
jgi:steroid delta-isomerase